MGCVADLSSGVTYSECESLSQGCCCMCNNRGDIVSDVYVPARGGTIRASS